MRRLLLVFTLLATGLTGCRSASLSKQNRIENDIRLAIQHGHSPERIEQLVQQAKDPSHAAAVAVWAVMHLISIPTEMERNWSQYCSSEPSVTPSVEIYEVINSYKVSVLRVLLPYGVDLDHDYTGMPLVFWQGWGNPPVTPELLDFLLANGYDPNPDGPSSSPLGFCAHPGQSFLRYDHKYEMIQALLAHGAHPNVMSRGTPILHQLILYNRDNPYLLDIIRLLLEAGADVNGIDDRGHTPLDVALAYSQMDDRTPEIVDILERFNAKRSTELPGDIAT